MVEYEAERVNFEPEVKKKTRCGMQQKLKSVKRQKHYEI